MGGYPDVARDRVIAQTETLPDMPRATAALVRIHHGHDCPDALMWRRVSTVLELAAAGEMDPLVAVQTARVYLTAEQPAEVVAHA